MMEKPISTVIDGIVWLRSLFKAWTVLCVTSIIILSTSPAIAGGNQYGNNANPNAHKQRPFDIPPPPPENVYDGPLFTLSHNYPKHAYPPQPSPWRSAINYAQINTSNAEAYVNALKDYIADDMQTLLYDTANWNPDERGWYNQPWLSTIREPIHGTYVGSTFPPGMFPLSGLTQQMTTHVLVYYDSVAAQSVGDVWGKSGRNPLPGLKHGGAQFPEGSIIIKPAFTTAGGDVWPPIAGAFPWQIYAPPGDGQSGDPELQTVYLFQFDIIVKDSKSAPQTGWVFSTLVYDGSVEGDNWDKLIPLGAMWGNDPEVNSPEDCNYLPPNDCPALYQTWVNTEVPLYSIETLGWGGRLSGPNDGSVDIDAAIETADGDLVPFNGRLAMSSCMSCHGTAEYEMQSFLLPAPAECSDADDECTPKFALCENDSCEQVEPGPGVKLIYHEPGTDEFRRWFQSRPGDVPQDPGTIALDYGMNVSFKSLPLWLQATGRNDSPNFVEEFNSYRGLQYENSTSSVLE